MSKRAILVAGGAGYIGSHFCHVAARRGFSPVVVDRIEPSTERVAAYRRSIARHFPLEVCDIADEAHIARLIEQHAPVAAVCFAALIEVGESVANPPLFWDNNYARAMRFFRTLTRGGIRHLVFSSTAAVYDSTTGAKLLAESDQLVPASPYGLTKLACELALQGASASHNVRTHWMWRSASRRSVHCPMRFRLYRAFRWPKAVASDATRLAAFPNC